MASEDFVIRILLDARSKIAPVMAAAVAEAEKLSSSFKNADKSAEGLDKRLVQTEAHLSKMRDTLRSINPTVDAFDRKFKSLSTTLTAVNRNMAVLERASAKAAGSLGSLAGIIEKLEKKLSHLDERMTEMGARKYEVEMQADTAKAEAKVEALEQKLASAVRGVYTAKTDVETAAAMAKAEALKRELERLGKGDRANRIVWQVTAQMDRSKFDADLKAITNEARLATREPISWRAQLGLEEFNPRFEEARRKLFELANIRVQPSVHLGSAGFELERRKVEAQLVALGLRREHVRIILDYDKNQLERVTQSIGQQLIDFAQRFDTDFQGINRRLADAAITVAITFAEPLISALTGVAGALVAVGAAAGVAAGGLVGLATAVVAQVLPVIGLLVVAFTRIAAVLRVVHLQTQAQDKSQQASLASDKQKASSLEALRSAHEAVAQAQRNLALAQDSLNEARRQGVRTIQDLVLAERNANLQAAQSKIALATQVATGGGGGLIQSAQLQATSDQITAGRARVDARTAVAGGVNQLPAVKAAARGVDDARRSLEQANRQVLIAQRNLNIAGESLTSTANNYQVALAKLSAGERVLLRSVERFRKLFTDKNSPIRGISDAIVVSFAHALDSVRRLLEDPATIKVLQSLGGSIAESIDRASKFLTTGPMRKAFQFFASESAKNLGSVERIFEHLFSIFTSIAKAASGPLKIALQAINGFLGNISDHLSSREGQDSLKNFFEGALKPISAFLRLGGAILKLFAAIAGPGGASEEGTRGINALTESINRATEYVKTHSEEVQKFFHDAIFVAGQVLRVVLAIGAAFIKVFDPKTTKIFADFLIQIVIPTLATLVKLLGQITKIILDLSNTAIGGFLIKGALFATAIAFLGTKFIGVLNPLGKLIIGLGKLPGLLDRFAAAGLSGKFGTIGERLGFMAAKVSEMLRKVPILSKLLGEGGAAGAGGGKAGSTVARDVGTGATAGVVASRIGTAASVAGAVGTTALAGVGAVKAAQALSNLLSGNREGARGALRSGFRTVLGPGVGGQLGEALFGKEKQSDVKAFSDKIKDLGTSIKDLPAGKLMDLAHEAGVLASKSKDGSGRIDDLAHSLVKLAQDRETEQTIKRIRLSFTDLATKGRLDLKGFAEQVQENMVFIRHHLDVDSQQGKEALSANFASAAEAIKIQMARAGKTTKEGLDRVNELMIKSITVWGLSRNQALAYLHIRNRSGSFERDTSTGPAGAGKAYGGWVGMQGERGRDQGMYSLGRGEAVLNWAHQKIVDPAMAWAKGVGISPYGSLDEMFSRVRAYHAAGGTGYAGGGRVQANFGGHPSNVTAGIRNLIALMQSRYPLAVSSTTDHSLYTASGNISDHSTGHAVDLSGPLDVMYTASNWIKTSGLYRRIKQGIHNPNLAVNDGVIQKPPGQFGGVWADHANHIHLALAGALGKFTAAVFRKIMSPQVVGGGGFGNIVQFGLNRATAASNRILRLINRQRTGQTADSGYSQPADVGLDSIDHVFPRVSIGDPSAARFSPKLVRRIAAWAGLPSVMFEKIAHGESNYEPGVVSSDGGWGLWQNTPRVWGVTALRFLRTLGGIGQLLNPLKNARMAKYLYDNAPSKTPNTPGFPWYGTQYLASGGRAWGGWHAGGMDRLVTGPTLFGAGEKGTERVTITPMATGGRPTATGQFAQPVSTKSPISSYLAVLNSIIGFAPFAGLSAAVDAAIGSIKRLANSGKKKTQEHLNKISKALDFLTSDNGPFAAIEQAISDRAARAARRLQQRIFKASGRRGLTDVGQIGAAEIAGLQEQRGGLSSELTDTNQLLKQARAGLARAKNPATRKRFQAEVNRLLAQREKVQQSLADNAQAIVERQEQLQSDLLTASNAAFDKQRNRIDQASRVATIRGGDQAGFVQNLIDLANLQLADLTKRMQDAQQTGNVDLAGQIQDQIDELNTSVVELSAQKIQTIVDQINKNAATALATNDFQQRLANLGVAPGGRVNIANLGRTNFAALGSALVSRGGILQQQRAGLVGQLNAATAAGDKELVTSLTQQIQTLDGDIIDNTKAVRDNTDAAFNYAISQKQDNSNFLLGLNDAAGTINNGLSAITGTTDTETQRGILLQRGGILEAASTSNRSFLIQLLSSIGIGAGNLQNVHGNALVPLLTTLYNQAIASGKLDDTQISTLKDLITAIVNGEEATIENTNALNQLNGAVIQSFSTTAWQLFRTAIFNGSGGLLPQYQIPAMATGGMITSTGILVGHRGEEIIPAGVDRSSSTNGQGEQHNWYVTSPTEVADPDYFAQVFSFKRSRARAVSK